MLSSFLVFKQNNVIISSLMGILIKEKKEQVVTVKLW